MADADEQGGKAHVMKVEDPVLAAEAKNAADDEHQMTLWRAVKLYPHAIGWSMLLSSTLIMAPALSNSPQ